MSFEFTKGPFINERGQRQLSEGIAKIISFDDSLDTTRAMFYLWMKMPNMEHGGRPVTVVASRENKFKVSNILLTKMTGQWFLRVDLEPRAPHNPRTDFDGELPITQWLE